MNGILKNIMTAPNCAVFESIPDQFLDCPAVQLVELLPGPSLFDLPGRERQPLFVSVLLHGNENTGLAAAQEVLRRYLSHAPRRSLLLFVGNVAAAAANVRTLPHQADYNRVWQGTLTPDIPEAHMARWVFDYAAARQPFASIDIHNNTGLNPHYACITRLEPQFIALARLFSRTIVHFERPLGVQAGAFAKLCPAITVECGKAGGCTGTAHAVELIEACLSITQLPLHNLAPLDVDLYHTYAIVKTPVHASLSFDGSPADFRFRSDIDRLNFSKLEAGELFGKIDDSDARLVVLPGDGYDSTDVYFDYRDGQIRLTQDVVPAMLTQDPHAIRQDCLCYLMHAIGIDGGRL
jgi:succinylglutamate desuccinylase